VNFHSHEDPKFQKSKTHNKLQQPGPFICTYTCFGKIRLATGHVLSLLGTKELTKFHVTNWKNSYLSLCCFILRFMLRLYQSLKLHG